MKNVQMTHMKVMKMYGTSGLFAIDLTTVIYHRINKQLSYENYFAHNQKRKDFVFEPTPNQMRIDFFLIESIPNKTLP